ncbi:hypothetical protein L9F63_006354, partial [Diploptera punctata]
SEYYIISGNQYGNDLGNGSWSGVVGKIMNNELDLCINEMVWNSERSNVIDYIESIIKS